MKLCISILIAGFGATLISLNGKAESGSAQAGWVSANATSLTDTFETIGARMAWRLTRALDLTTSQNDKVTTIFAREIAATEALGDHAKSAEIDLVQKRTAEEIRALLTARQATAFNLIPHWYGGGLFGLPPEDQVFRLDSLVDLTRAQKKAARAIYTDGMEHLMENQTPERSDRAWIIRREMDAEIRAILMPKQQKIWDITPQTKGGGLW